MTRSTRVSWSAAAIRPRGIVVLTLTLVGIAGPLATGQAETAAAPVPAGAAQTALPGAADGKASGRDDAVPTDAAAPDQPGFSARAVTPSMTFEKAPGVLGTSIRSKRLEGLRAYATEPLGLTALGLEDAGLAPVNKKDRIEVNLGERIRFDDKGDKIPAAAHRLLDGIGRVLAENPETAIEIRAHTDDQGDAGFNLRLSQRRADAIRAYLIGRGVDPGRISGVGLGESAPIAGAKGRSPSRADRAKNRRVELAIVPREIPESELAAAPVSGDPDGEAASEVDPGSDPDAAPSELEGVKPRPIPPRAPQGATQ